MVRASRSFAIRAQAALVIFGLAFVCGGNVLADPGADLAREPSIAERLRAFHHAQDQAAVVRTAHERATLLPKTDFQVEDRRHLPWNRNEKAMMWSYLALSWIDAYQTANLPEGYEESNPLAAAILGDRPDPTSVAAFKFAATYGILYLPDRLCHTRKSRRRLLWILNLLQAYVVISNETVTDGILF